MGVILNRPDAESMNDTDSPVQRWIHSSSPPYSTFVGGPVEPDGYLCLRRDDTTTSGVASVDIMIESPNNNDSHRVFRGYAGWSAGQLSDEIDSGGWFVVPSRHTDAFDGEPSTLWQRVLGRQPGRMRRLAGFPADPTMN